MIFLRLPPMPLAAKIARLNTVLQQYAGQLDQFIVVGEGGIRVRHARHL